MPLGRASTASRNCGKVSQVQSMPSSMASAKGLQHAPNYEHQVRIFLLTGCQGEATVAHHHTGNAVITRTRTQWIPKDLGVHVRMAVDKPWADHMALGINSLPRLAVKPTNGCNFAVLNRYVCAIAGPSDPSTTVPSLINKSYIFPSCSTAPICCAVLLSLAQSATSRVYMSYSGQTANNPPLEPRLGFTTPRTRSLSTVGARVLSSSAQWILNLDALGKVCQPVTVDLWGHGKSGSRSTPIHRSALWRTV